MGKNIDIRTLLPPSECTAICTLLKHLAGKICADVYLEGSFAKRTADRFSDIDLALITEKHSLPQSVETVAATLRSMKGVLGVLTSPADKHFPGYRYVWAMFRQLGTFRVIDIAVTHHSKTLRGKRVLLLSLPDTPVPYQLCQTKDTAREQKIKTQLLLLPGLYKQFLRKADSCVLQWKCKQRILQYYPRGKTRQELASLIRQQQWSAVLQKHWDTLTSSLNPAEKKRYAPLLKSMKKAHCSVIRSLRK